MERTNITIHTGDTLASALEQLEQWASQAGKCANLMVTIHVGVETLANKEK